MKLLVAFLLLTGFAVAQDLPARWEELTASDWPKALCAVKADTKTLELQKEFFDRVKK